MSLKKQAQTVDGNEKRLVGLQKCGLTIVWKCFGRSIHGNLGPCRWFADFEKKQSEKKRPLEEFLNIFALQFFVIFAVLHANNSHCNIMAL